MGESADRDALEAELRAAGTRRVLLNCAMFAVSLIVVCLFLWLVVLYRQAGAFSSQMVPFIAFAVLAFAAMLVPSFKLHALQERCKRIKAMLAPQVAAPSPSPTQPFGQISELEHLELHHAALVQTRNALRLATLCLGAAFMVFAYFLQAFVENLPRQSPLPPEYKQQMLHWMIGLGALMLPLLGLGVATVIYNVRVRRVGEELEQRRMFPRLTGLRARDSQS